MIQRRVIQTLHGWRYVSTVENVRGERTNYVGNGALDMADAWQAAEANAAALREWGVPFAHGKPCRVVRVVLDPAPRPRRAYIVPAR